VYVKGERDSQTFDTKAQAVSWATQRELELTGAKLPTHSMIAALRKYAREVAPKRKGEHWESLRCTALERAEWAHKPIAAVSATDLAQWRDARLQSVSGATVRREFSLLRSLFEIARKEWKWIRENPLAEVERPPASASRKRRITQDEIDRIVLSLGYLGGEPETQSQRVALVFLFALETAMRSGEITGLYWRDVGPHSVQLPETKNGDAREVALSVRAREILSLLPKGDGPVFGVEPAMRDALFRKARDRAKVANLHFHDARAEAIWRLSKKLDVMELARMIGHRDLRSLLIYYQTSAAELAAKLG
jgi:integrase